MTSTALLGWCPGTTLKQVACHPRMSPAYSALWRITCDWTLKMCTAFPKNVIESTLHRLAGLLRPGRENTTDTTVLDNWTIQQWYSTASIRTLHPPPWCQNHPHQTPLHGLDQTPFQYKQEGSTDYRNIMVTSHSLHERLHGIPKWLGLLVAVFFSLAHFQFFPSCISDHPPSYVGGELTVTTKPILPHFIYIIRKHFLSPLLIYSIRISYLVFNFIFVCFSFYFTQTY